MHKASLQRFFDLARIDLERAGPELAVLEWEQVLRLLLGNGGARAPKKNRAVLLVACDVAVFVPDCLATRRKKAQVLFNEAPSRAGRFTSGYVARAHPRTFGPGTSAVT